MSGLLGSPGPGVSGKVLGYGEKKYESKEKAGFSGTKIQNKRGEWVSIDKGLSAKKRKHRQKTVHHALALGII